jgi:hypothetical protein
MKKLALLLMTLTYSNFSMAASYQAQGCGLGSTLWTDGSSLVHQVLGSTTNTSSGTQTFGMTSGTSNCELDSIDYANIVFIKANRIALANDIARGNGETIMALSRLYGKNHRNMGPLLKNNYTLIFPSESTSANDIYKNINKVLKTN